MYVFNVNTDLLGMKFIGEILIILGIVFLVLFTSYFLRTRRRNEGTIRAFSGILIVFVVLMVVGSSFYFLNNSSPSQILISNNQITLSGEFIGNQTFSSDQVNYAFTENLNSGNLTLSNRNMGSSLGNIKEGLFTLSNGAKADVITNNLTVLVVELTTGTDLVLGCNNTMNLAHDFAIDVHPVSGL